MNDDTASPRSALVTGGAQRLGRAIALALAADGWNVAIHYRDSRALAEATADDVRALGGARRGRAARPGRGRATSRRCSTPARPRSGRYAAW